MIRVTRFEYKETGLMRALLDVELDIILNGEPLTIKLTDCKLMVQKDDENSLWIGLPSSQRYVGGSASYYNLIGFGNRDQSNTFSAMVLEAIDEFRGGRAA